MFTQNKEVIEEQRKKKDNKTVSDINPIYQ